MRKFRFASLLVVAVATHASDVGNELEQLVADAAGAVGSGGCQPDRGLLPTSPYAGKVNCELVARKMATLLHTFLHPMDDATPAPTTAQICRTFKPLYTAKAYMPHITHLAIQTCVHALEIPVRLPNAKAGVALLEMLSQTDALKVPYFGGDPVGGGELYASWSRMLRVAGMWEESAVKAKQAADKVSSLPKLLSSLLAPPLREVRGAHLYACLWLLVGACVGQRGNGSNCYHQGP